MTDDLSGLKRAMRCLSEAVDDMPDECQDYAGNALVNLAAEKVVEDVGHAEAARSFLRLGTLLTEGRQPPAQEAICLTALDA